MYRPSRPVRVGSCLVSILGLVFAAAAAGADEAPSCTGARTVSANVVALDQPLTLNRLGATIPGGMIFALASDVVPIGDDSTTCAETACTHGEVRLRADKRPRPMALRVNEGDCLAITFTNLLSDAQQCFDVDNQPLCCTGDCCQDEPTKDCTQGSQCTSGQCLSFTVAEKQPPTRSVGLHVEGLEWVRGSQDDGAFVGQNVNSFVAPGGTTEYLLLAAKEGPYVLYSAADDWSPLQSGGQAQGGNPGDGGTLTEGLFGSVIVEPSGYQANAIDPSLALWQSEHYRSQVSEQDLCWASRDGGPSRQNPDTCVRARPDVLPEIDYQAVYQQGSRQGMPILSMLCTQAVIDNGGTCTLDEIVHTDLTAVITGPSDEKGNPQRFPQEPIPGSDGRGERGVPANPTFRQGYSYPRRLEPYREFAITYHESYQANQAFAYYYQLLPSLSAASDSFGINYSMGGLSSPILSTRLQVGPVATCTDCKYEEFFLSSWTMGDPGMPVDKPTSTCVSTADGSITRPCPPPTKALYPDDPSNVYHSYMRDHLKFRVMHGGVDLHHLHHQHAHQWLASPQSPEGDYLDSQSIGPGTAFTMEMVYNGSGNVNQTVGDSIFHCHFYPHFASGMWGLWRVHDVFEAGTPLDADGVPVAGTRAYPDSQIANGTPIPGLVPLPTVAMAPLPAPVRLEPVADGNTDVMVKLVTDLDAQTVADADWVSAVSPGKLPPDKTYLNPGYPFFIPATPGMRPSHPPGDFAFACSDNGAICDPGIYDQEFGEHRRDLSACADPATAKCLPLDGGLPRNVFRRAATNKADFLDPAELTATALLTPFANTNFAKKIENAAALALPEGGTLVEKIAMQTHATRSRPSVTPEGRPGDFILNGLKPVPGAPYADPCIQFRPQGGPAEGALTNRYLAADLQFDDVFNKEGWHFPQQRIIALWDDVQPTLDGSRAPEPLFLRVNSYDCVEYVLANLVPNVYELDDFQVRTPTDVLGQHIHLVKFDVTSSDGAANGWNYEDGTFAPNEVTERIDAINAAGGIMTAADPEKRSKLKASFIPFFGAGPVAGDTSWLGSQATIQRWYDDPLLNNHGVCSDRPAAKCTSADLSACASPRTASCVASAGVCSNDGSIVCTVEQEAKLCGDPKAICIPDNDRTIRTIFTHDHFSPSTHQQAGLYAGLVVEPRGSQWLDNETGDLMGGWDPATGEMHQVRFDGGPTSWQAVIRGPAVRADELSFREFMLQIQDSALFYLPFEDLPPRIGVCSTDLEQACTQATDCPSPAGERPKCEIASLCSTDNREICTADTDCPDDPEGNPGTCGTVGFCSNTGICSNAPGRHCVLAPPPPTATNTVQQQLDQQYCGTGQCLLKTDALTSCTTDNLDNCLPLTTAGGTTQVNACNFVPGVPSTNWNAGNPINDGITSNIATVEAVTFMGSTNNFSFNYRNEPLFPRTTDAQTGQPVNGNAGDLSFGYASIPRPNLVYGWCNEFSPPCHCTDNGADCNANSDCNNGALCSPYPPLTSGVRPDDPFTPLLRAYAGDDVQVRTLVGAHINPHNFTVHGLNWMMEPSFVDSGWRNSQVMGISEHFELLLKVPPPLSTAPADTDWSDFLYQPGFAAVEQASGSWGLLRAYNSEQKEGGASGPLFPLPQNPPDKIETASMCDGEPPTGTTRSYTVIATTATQALTASGQQLVYNQLLSIEDPNALLFFTIDDLEVCTGTGNAQTCTACTVDTARTCTLKTGVEPAPLVLRAAAGDCLSVTLYNAISVGPNGAGVSSLQIDGNTSTPPFPVTLTSNISGDVGLRPQLVTYDVRHDDGTNAGFNPTQTISATSSNKPMNSITYTWYAGNFDPSDPDSEQGYIPIEFGAANLLPPDPLNHYRHALFGGLIIEPQGATWCPPDQPGCDPSAVPTTGVDALVSYTDQASGEPTTFREHVVFFQDDLQDLTVTVPSSGTGTGTLTSATTVNAINYKSPYLGIKSGANSIAQRFCDDACSQPLDLSCDLGADSSHQQVYHCTQWNNDGSCATGQCQGGETPLYAETFEACAGEQVRFRVLHPGGVNTNQVFELYGHNFSEAPYMTETVGCESPLMHTNLWASQFIGNANLCGSTDWLTATPPADTPLWRQSLNDAKGSRMGQGPSNHFDALIAAAGGACHQPGDYLIHSYPADHFNAGAWAIFRVGDQASGVACPTPASPAGCPQ